MTSRVFVIIPAHNEGPSISRVVEAIPASVSGIIVIDNASIDNTAPAAKGAGAYVLFEPQKGYGAACLRGIDYLEQQAADSDIIVFLDGDYSDFPEQMYSLIKPISDGDAHMVIGSRVSGNREAGSLMFHQRAGNWLATYLIKHLYGHTYTDLGPFRAIRWDKLVNLNMQDKTFGWTVEMQIKAVKQGLSITEVPVSYRKRIGRSKVSGTLYGTVMASYKIIGSILKNL